ncbi:MAG: CYTH domain-containing protein [Bacteroidales bacterium]
MKNEIERKFLVLNNDYRKLAKGLPIQQGFLNRDPSRSVRVRIVGNKAWLTIKGKSHGATRKEFEFQVPHDEAQEIINTFCLKPIISKVRYRIKIGDDLWEVDEFLKKMKALLLLKLKSHLRIIPYFYPNG